jgi:hypothetical protein
MGELDGYLLRLKADGRWELFLDFEWQASLVCTDEAGRTFVSGRDGRVAIIEGNEQVAEEFVFGTEDGVRDSGPVRNLRPIDGTVAVCGMSRSVLLRRGPHRWERIDQGAATDPRVDAVTGFNAFCDIGGGHVCAVGFNGEVWLRSNDTWNQMKSPTNVVLNDVCRSDAPGSYFACGQLGVVLKGGLSGLEVVNTGSIEEDLWGCAWHSGKCYFASHNSLFVLDGTNFGSVELNLPLEFTFRQLHAVPGAIWSFGMRNIAVSRDGAIWEDVTPKKGEIDALI